MRREVFIIVQKITFLLYSDLFTDRLLSHRTDGRLYHKKRIQKDHWGASNIG